MAQKQQFHLTQQTVLVHFSCCKVLVQLTLKDPTGLTNTPFDVTSNPKNIQITELEAAQIPRSIQDLDAAVINANYALPAGLNPTKMAYSQKKLTLHMQIFFPLTLVMKTNQLSKNQLKHYNLQKLRNSLKNTTKVQLFQRSNRLIVNNICI